MPQQPLQVPIIQKPTPIVLDQLLIESSDSNQGPFDRMLELGHYHPEQIKYPGHVLLKQGPNSYGLFQRIWGTAPVSQDSYNVAKEFEAESNTHPTFIRSYRVLRSDYLVTGPLAKGTAFTGIVAISVTAGGSGYTKDFAVTVSGTGTGFTGTAIVNRGAVVRIEITAVGSAYTGTPTVSFGAGDGTGATATAIIQPVAAVLVAEKHSKLPEDDPYANLYDRVIRVYQTMPGPELTDTIRSVGVRGRDVQIKTKKDLVGSIAVETGSGIISSKVDSLTSVVAQRTTEKVATLPPDEAWAFWDFVPLPMLLFDIVHTIFCNDSPQATVVTNPVTGGGSSVLRKHRKTVSYSAAYPNPDLSGSSFATADVRYSGKIIQFAYGNVLNDAISYSEPFAWASGGSACAWTEEYDFAATSPTATAFLAGAWYVRSYDVEPWGESGFKATKIEYYSADANPSI